MAPRNTKTHTHPETTKEARNAGETFAYGTAATKKHVPGIFLHKTPPKFKNPQTIDRYPSNRLLKHPI